MPITDKIAAAKKISELLNGIIPTGDFRLRYKIFVDPPAAENDFDKPVIKVELSGGDSPLVLERGGELLRAFEHVALEMLRLAPDEHDKVIFDCQNFRSARLEGTTSVGQRRRRSRARERHALRLRSHVIARAPSGASGPA